MATTTKHPLAKHVNSRKNIQVDRDLFEESSVSGYLIAMSDDLALLHTFDDFEPDGYMIIRTDDVEDVTRGKHERHWDRMLGGEGLLSGLDPEFSIDLSSMRTAIADIQRLFGKMVIQCEDRDEDDEETMYLASVVELTDRDAVIDELDATGHWGDEPEAIPYLDITTVEFDTPYINRFWKYAEGPAPNATNAG